MPLTPLPRTKRLHTRINARLMELAKREARDRRISLRSIVEAALDVRYAPEYAGEQDVPVLKELRGLRREVRHVEFGNRVLTELFTLTTKNLFARLPAATAESKLAGEGFYNALIASVERVFAQSTPLLDRLAASLLTETSADIDALAKAMETGAMSEVASHSEPAIS
ncbi:MAG: hypothetical protein H0X25_22370 [Acidobacteriales bacterium]|nr:hypothetical protein [Terriglobales bacterium]